MHFYGLGIEDSEMIWTERQGLKLWPYTFHGKNVSLNNAFSGWGEQSFVCFVNASLKAYTYLLLCGVGLTHGLIYKQGKHVPAELHLSSGRVFTKYLG